MAQESIQNLTAKYIARTQGRRSIKQIAASKIENPLVRNLTIAVGGVLLTAALKKLL